MAGHNPGITLKATCTKAKNNTLQFLADFQDVKYFKEGKEYAIHATELPDGGNNPGAGSGAAKGSGAKT